MKWISEGYGWRSMDNTVRIHRLAGGMFMLYDGERKVGQFKTARQAKDLIEATHRADRRATRR